MSTRTPFLLAFLMAIAPASTAGDRVFVSVDAVIEAYDFSTGQQLVGSPIALSSGPVDLDRTRGGAWVYVVDGLGEVRLINTRTLQTILSPANATAGVEDLSVNDRRGALYFAHRSPFVQIQDAAGFGASGVLNFGQGRILDTVSALPNGDRVYASDWSTGDLVEWNPATGGVAVVANLGFDAWELGSDPSSRFVVATGPDTFKAGSLGNPGDPLHVAVFDRWTGQLHKDQIAGGGIPSGLVFDRYSGPKFWVGSDVGVDSFHVIGSHLLHSPRRVGDPLVRDIACNQDGDLYLLYDDRIDRYYRGLSFDKRLNLPGDNWRFHLVVVPELDEPQGVLKLARPEWVGLLQAVKMSKWMFPWKLDPSQYTDEGCDPKAVYSAAKRAFYWLSTLKSSPEGLTPSLVGEFLAGAKHLDRQTAEHFLDLVLLDVQED